MLLTGIAVAGVTAYLGFVGILYVKQRDMVFPAWAVAPPDPGFHESIKGLERIGLETPDGERLLAYWRRPDAGKPTLLTFHGNGSTPQPHAERFARDPVWRDSGVGLLAPAYRGYPGSSGSPSEEGLITDGLAALDFLRTQLGEEHPVILHGHSLGSAIAIAVAAQRPVEALYLESPFTSALAIAKRQYPFIPGFLMRDPFRSDLRIAEASTAKVFIVHGAEDRVIRVEMARDLAALAPSPELFIVEDGDHVSILGLYDREVAETLGLLN